MNELMKPYAITFAERFDYDVRSAALRILGCGGEIGVALNDILVHPKLREILVCLAHMSYGGIVDYYRGDDEAASWCVSREYMLADELENLETDWFNDSGVPAAWVNAKPIQNYEGTRTLKARMKVDLTPEQREVIETRAQEVDAPPWRPQLPPGARVSATTLRGLALLRRRAAEE